MDSLKEIKNAKDLAEIENLVCKCTRCALHQTKIKDVPGVGSPKSEVLFIGEAPGKKEDEEGEPFIGAAGKFLTQMIEGIGLKREDVYITNVVKHRPPANRDPFPEEVKACEPYLKKQIEIISPKLIVFLGRHAMNRFFPTLRISNVHGSAFRKKSELGEQVFLALYHPAAALYNGGMSETLIADFSKIPKILEKIKEQEGKSFKKETDLGKGDLEQKKLF